MTRPIATIIAEVCEEYGVALSELRYGTQKRTTGGRYPSQLTVSLARYTVIWRAWQGDASASRLADMLRMTDRQVRAWYADFNRRASEEQKLAKAMMREIRGAA